MRSMIRFVSVALVGWIVLAGATAVYAQEKAAEKAGKAADAPKVTDAKLEAQPGAKVEEKGHEGGSPGFFTVIAASGAIGLGIWVMLFGNLVALTYFASDCALVIRAKRIIPQALVAKVTESMAQGDVFKALQNCKDEPGPLANVLSAGFHNVEEGFETIQDMVAAAAEMESENLVQRVVWLNVVSNMGPLLGLLGTVHGMIFAFATLAGTQAGAAQQAMLAINIAESLYCTAAGLLTAIPALGLYYYFKNKATRLILGMEALTLDLIKSLRNVEVVSE